MAHLIAQGGKLCVSAGRLVTSAEGAPCVCGDDCAFPEALNVTVSGTKFHRFCATQVGIDFFDYWGLGPTGDGSYLVNRVFSPFDIPGRARYRASFGYSCPCKAYCPSFDGDNDLIIGCGPCVCTHEPCDPADLEFTLNEITVDVTLICGFVGEILIYTISVQIDALDTAPEGFGYAFLGFGGGRFTFAGPNVYAVTSTASQAPFPFVLPCVGTIEVEAA